MPDLVQGDEIGDLAADRRDRDLGLAAPPADRPAARRGSDQLDPVVAAELLDVGLHQLHTPTAERLAGLPEHGRQPSPDGGGSHTWLMAESTNLRLALAQIDPTVGDIDGNVALI